MATGAVLTRTGFQGHEEEFGDGREFLEWWGGEFVFLFSGGGMRLEVGRRFRIS